MEKDIFKAAEIEIVYKTTIRASERPLIVSSSDAYNVLLLSWNMNLIDLQEQFKVLFLNRGNRVLGIYHHSSGSITGTIADPKLILAAALKAGACYLMLCHNHPSASLRPSRMDEALTKKLAEAANLLDMRVLDHIIISSEGYFSFADEGLL